MKLGFPKQDKSWILKNCRYLDVLRDESQRNIFLRHYGQDFINK